MNDSTPSSPPPAERARVSIRAGVILPLLALLGASAFVIAVWYVLDRNERRAVADGAQRTLAAVEYAVQNFARVRLASVENLAGRLGVVEATQIPQLFQHDAEVILRDHPAVQALLQVDRGGRIVRIVSREDLQQHVGTRFAVSPERLEAEQTALREGRAVGSPPLNLHNDTLGFSLAMPLLRRDEHGGLLAAGVRYETLLQMLLRTTAAGYAVEVRDGERLVYTRDARHIAPYTQWKRSGQARLYGRNLSIDVWPTAAAVPVASRRLGQFVLWGGLTGAALLALALRLAAVARARAALAESARAELGASRRQSGELLDSVTDAMLALDSDWRLTYCNARAESLLGLDRTRSMGQPLWQELPAAHVAQLREQLEQAAASRTSRAFEFLHADRQHCFDVRVYPYADGVSVYLRDETERRSAEQRIRASEALLAQAQRVAQLGSWAVDLADGRVWWSENYATVMDLDADAQPGFEAFLARVHPDDRENMTRAREAIDHRGEPMDALHRLVRRSDGALRWIHHRGEARIGADGRLESVTGTAQDVTERVAVEQALRTSEARLAQALATNEAVMQGSLDLICTFDREGHFVQVSAASERLLGYRSEDLIGRNYIELVHPDDREHSRTETAAIIAGVPTVDLQDRYLHRDGHIVDLTWSAVWSERHALMFCVARDVSERRRIEAAERAQRAIVQGIAAGRPLADTLQAIVAAFEQQHPGALASIQLYDAGASTLTHGAGAQIPAAYVAALEGVRIGPTAGSCGTAVWRGERVVVADIEHDPLWVDYATLALAHGLRSCWSSLISASDGRIIGTFAIYHREVHAPSAADFAGIDVASAQAGIAIERAHALRALEVGEQRYRSMFENHPDAVYSLDLQGRITGANPAAERLIGLPARRAIGMEIEQFVPAEARDVNRSRRASVLAGQAQSYVAEGMRGDGERFVAQITSVPIVVDGKVVGVHGIARDITALKRTEESLERAVERGRRQSAQLAGLSRAAMLANTKVEDDDLAQCLVDELRQTLGSHMAVLNRLGVEGWSSAVTTESLSEKYRAWSGFKAEIDGTGIYAVVCETNRPLRLTQEQLLAHPRWRGFGAHAGEHPPMRGWLAVPMIGTDGRNIGVLQASDKADGEFDAADEAIAVQFARMAAVALERARLMRELRDAERRIGEQLAFTAAISASMAEGVYAVDQGGHLTYMNPAAERMLGVRAADLMGQALEPEMNAAQDGVPGARTIAAPAREALLRGVDVVEDDARLLRADGQPVDIAYSASPLRSDGAVIGAVVAFRDIGQHKRAEQALLERDRFFELSEEMFAIGLNGRFVQVNPAFGRVLGYPRERLVSDAFTAFLHPDDVAATEKAVAAARPGGSPSVFLVRARRADGSYTWIEWTLARGHDGTSFSVGRDVNAHVEAQNALRNVMDELQARNIELQDFAFVASHDLQEPLRKIQAFGEKLVAQVGAEDELAADYVRRMRSAASRMQVLISDLLAYSCVSTRAQPFREVDLGEVARSVLEDLEPMIERSEARVTVHPLPSMRADATQMRQLLQNLISNSIKFRAPGRALEVEVRATQVERALPGSTEPVPCIELKVADNGIGFDNKYRERMFQPFQRLHGRGEYEGTGIGLAIVRKIVERHGGSVRADGRPGEGATVTVTLPVQRHAAGSAVAA